MKRLAVLFLFFVLAVSGSYAEKVKFYITHSSSGVKDEKGNFNVKI